MKGGLWAFQQKGTPQNKVDKEVTVITVIAVRYSFGLFYPQKRKEPSVYEKTTPAHGRLLRSRTAKDSTLNRFSENSLLTLLTTAVHHRIWQSKVVNVLHTRKGYRKHMNIVKDYGQQL